MTNCMIPGHALDAAILALRDADRRHDADPSPDTEVALCAAIDAVHAASEAVLARPAWTVADLKVKARAMEWKCRGNQPGEISMDMEPETAEAFRTMLADIAALPEPVR